jgi:hypothetical protein
MAELQRAPEFPQGVPWLGAGDRAPRFDGDLRGQVVLICFFTASSAHCHSALATLSLLQLRFTGEPFVVLGVHAARRPEERGPESVAATAQRMRVRFPVLCDDERRAFDAFGCGAWPTFVLVGGDRVIRFRGAGAPDVDRLIAAVRVLCTASAVPPTSTWQSAWPPLGPTERTELRWPAGLAVDRDRGLLWIADSGRDRLLGVTLEGGAIRHEVGCGVRGFADGDSDLAAFAEPRGLTVIPDGILCADFLNHALRRIDSDGNRVSTLCGDGSPGSDDGVGGPSGIDVLDDRDAVVACAAFHQLRSVSSVSRRAEVVAGTGVSGSEDGLPLDATLAEPRDVAVRGPLVAFVDGGSDALRVLDREVQRVTTWLTDDALGAPCGVAWWNEQLLVCDTLRNRVVRVASPLSEPVVVAGPDAGLLRPEAIVVSGDVAIVADTGRHRVVKIDLGSGVVEPFDIVDPHADHAEPVPPPIEARAGGLVSLSAHLPRPDGTRVDGDLGAVGLAGSLEGDVAVATVRSVEMEGEWAVLREVPTGPPGSGALRFVVRYATRSHHGHARHVLERDIVRAVTLTADGPDAIEP